MATGASPTIAGMEAPVEKCDGGKCTVFPTPNQAHCLSPSRWLYSAAKRTTFNFLFKAKCSEVARELAVKEGDVAFMDAAAFRRQRRDDSRQLRAWRGREMAKKLVVELQELAEIQSRFKKTFILTNILTLLLVAMVFEAVLVPAQWERFGTAGMCVIAAGAILLCFVQLYFIRLTTRKSREKLEALTFMDDLTRVYNYRYLDRRLDEEMKRCQRYTRPISLIYLDLDGFKRVNDQFGHRAGNAVLTQVGQFLRNTARDSDLIGRLGGDEFLIILPETDRDDALVFAERMKERLAKQPFKTEEGATVDFIRFSMGVASHPGDASTKEALIAAADQAMYRAKRTGGDKVCL
ncbi:MAG: GGDEF domain-containing protein [Planctomycetes bacterium]|nr:GGDEF domain-containing protein [Planctomycetota bacterium]MBM4083701.1 GGDEF domain-containing protein [Planctomycetota bacterium]